MLESAGICMNTQDSKRPVPHQEIDGGHIAGPELPGFQQFSFGFRGASHCVYYAGDRSHPALLVMPEIAGLSPGLIYFAQRLVAARFQVYVPWLFGPFQRRAPLRNVLRLCISREFGYLRAGRPAPVADWLRALVQHISCHNRNAPVGAIGMCLTGSFVIPLIIDPKVPVAVAAQPSVPCSLLFAAWGIGAPAKMRALNVSSEQISQARARLTSEQARLLAVRCRADRICPADKMARLQQEFPVGLTVKEYGEVDSRNRVGDRPHALYTKEFRILRPDQVEHYARRAFADLVQFFEPLRQDKS
jgi:dienelactone hydrolase